MYCSKCGRELPPGVSVCPVCSQKEPQATNPHSSLETKRYGYLKSQQSTSIFSTLILLIFIFWLRSNLYEVLYDMGVDVSYSDISSFRTILLILAIALVVIDVFTYLNIQKVYLEVTPDYVQGNGLKSLAFPSTQSFKVSYHELSETRFMFNAASGILQIPLHGGWISLPIENSVEARKLIEERRATAGTP